MITHTSIENGLFKVETGLESLNKNIFWIDLINPTKEEIERIEEYFGVELFTSQESEEIESSSKYNETENEIGINLNFLRKENNKHINDPVSFILRKDFLITQREHEYKGGQIYKLSAITRSNRAFNLLIKPISFISVFIVSIIYII